MNENFEEVVELILINLEKDKSLADLNEELLEIITKEELRSIYEHPDFIENIKYEIYKLEILIKGYESIGAIPRLSFSHVDEEKLARAISCYISGDDIEFSSLGYVKPFYVEKQYFIDNFDRLIYHRDKILNIPMDSDILKKLQLRRLIAEKTGQGWPKYEQELMGLVEIQIEKDRLDINLPEIRRGLTHKL